jgi:hypothetical protein
VHYTSGHYKKHSYQSLKSLQIIMTDFCSGQALRDADTENDADKSNPYMSPFSRRHNKIVWQHLHQPFVKKREGCNRKERGRKAYNAYRGWRQSGKLALEELWIAMNGHSWFSLNKRFQSSTSSSINCLLSAWGRDATFYHQSLFY